MKSFFNGLENLPKTICDKKGHKYTKLNKLYGIRGCMRCTCLIYTGTVKLPKFHGKLTDIKGI